MQKTMTIRAQVTLLIAAVCAALMLVAFVPTEAHAISASNGAKVKTMKMNKTYKCNINGDKKQEKVRVTFKSGTVKVYVNGKVKWTDKKGGFDCNAALITLKNGKTLLYYDSCADSYDYERILHYKSGKMCSLLNSQKLTASSYANNLGFRLEKVSGNTLSAKFVCVSYGVGYMGADVKYTYKNGALKKTSAKAPVRVGFASNDGTYKASRSMKAYTSAKCTKAKFTIKKGQKVEIKNVYFTSKTMSFQVKVGNKTGWIKGQTQKQFSKYGSCLFDGLFLVS